MPFAPCTYSLTYIYKADSAGWVWTVKERNPRKSWIFSACWTALDKFGRLGGGAGGIRTLDTALGPYNGLAKRRLQPLGHSSEVHGRLLFAGQDVFDRFWPALARRFLTEDQNGGAWVPLKTGGMTKNKR